MTLDPVLAVDTYDDNAGLITAAYRLGHLRNDWSTLDVTYDKGVFWKDYRPPTLVMSDIEPSSPLVRKDDFRALPWLDDAFDVVVFDPPYGLRGTVNETNGGYGLGAYHAIAARHGLMIDGLAECCRVARHRVLAKCQDQVCSGRLWWQTRMLIDAADDNGWTPVERLDMLGGGRDQPERDRWVCLACGKGSGPDDDSAGPSHRCRARLVWLDAHPEAEGPAPWLEQRPSPQRHAYGRPSSLLIFAKRGARG